MGTITSGIGLVSGINTSDIIDKLMALEAKPKDKLQSRIDEDNQRKTAYTDLQTRLTTLRLSATILKKPSTFQNASATSSDEGVMTANASAGAATGSYQFQVARLVTTQQAISAGFADASTAKVGAGTITIEQGGGELFSQTPLAQLRGGDGIRRGSFRITDRSGKTEVIDISAAVTLEDVVRKINTSLDISVRASLGKEGLVLSDISGGSGNFIVQDLGDGMAAHDLGITGVVAGTTINGTDINYLGRATSLSALNDGRGVRHLSSGTDFVIANGGSNYNVSLKGLNTLGEVIDAINTATGGAVKAQVAAGANGIQLVGTGQISVSASGGSKAAADLGILKTAGDTLNGDSVISSLGTVLLASLRGGSGLNLGTITITNKSGASATVDLSGSTTVQDLLDKINAGAAGISVAASLKTSGNGIQLSDASGGTGNLSVAEGSSTTAAELGLISSTPGTVLQGANLQRQWVSENSLLSTYNGGKGVNLGRFRITNSKGIASNIDLSVGNFNTLGDVIAAINAKHFGVTASINANGDGLLLTDSAGGAMPMKVEDVDGTTARDLNIKKDATGTTIDGSFEKTLTISASDTLSTVQSKINDLGFGMSAAIINDGSGLAPYRLSLTAREAGRAGRVVFDAGATGLAARNLVEAQDAAVFMGGGDSAQPLLITASRNQISGVIRGVTIDLHGVSNGPVTLNVTRDSDNVATELQKFTDTFNDLVGKLQDLTKFDTDAKQRGLLLGENSVQQIETEVYSMLQEVVSSNSKYRVLGDVGLTLGDGAKLEFDADKFKTAYADDPTEVQRLFTLAPVTTLESGTLLSDLRSSKGVRRAVSGADFRVTLHDGSFVDVDLSSATTMNDVINTINSSGGTKLSAKIADDGKRLQLVDTTNGTNKLAVGILNGSLAASDLGLIGSTTAKTLSGSELVDTQTAAIASLRAGAGYAMEARINKLIDPVSGVIPRENKNLDDRTQQFQDRIDALDKLLEAKRTRLERQFANMESILAGLQTQQQALSSLSSISSGGGGSSSKK